MSGHSRVVNISSTDVLLLVAILAVASFARFWDLGGVGFNNDEAVYSGQAANLAGYTEFSNHFSIFRAHPLLFQALAGLAFLVMGVSDTAARTVTATFGVLTVAVTYLIAKVLFRSYDDEIDRRNTEAGKRTFISRSTKFAITCSCIVALLPYHVIVSRQALVDVPFTFFFAVTILMMSMFYVTRNSRWLYLVGLSAGLSTLSKEVGFLTLDAAILYIFIIKQHSARNILAMIFTFALAVSPFIIFLALSGSGADSGSQYFDWQLSRNPNHPASFYFETLAGALGYALTGLVVISLAYEVLKSRRKAIELPITMMRETTVARQSAINSLRFSPKVLLAVFFIVPFLFFQFWPTKGYHYLHYGIVPLVLIGISLLFEDWTRKHFARPGLIVAAAFVLILMTTDQVVFTYIIPTDPKFVAGAGGLPKAREAALWIEQNSAPGAVVMTVGPTMGNVIKFYSHRDVVALAIPKSAPHNPAYSPIINPDLTVRNGEVSYMIYDLYSALRTDTLSAKLKYYAEKYNAPPVHIEYEEFTFSDGSTRTEPVIIVYQNYR